MNIRKIPVLIIIGFLLATAPLAAQFRRAERPGVTMMGKPLHMMIQVLEMHQTDLKISNEQLKRLKKSPSRWKKNCSV